MNIAIFGGTFDPVHNAHLIVAREAADRFSLDKVLFVTASQPPHKSATETSYEDRLAMVKIACACDPRFEASRIEACNRTSYSFHTIQQIRSSLAPGDRLFFLIGADAFAEIATWYRAADVITGVDFIVVTRPGHHYDTPSNAQVHRLDTLALPVSSSDIRDKLARGEPAPELPSAVLDYIQRRRLYAGHS